MKYLRRCLLVCLGLCSFVGQLSAEDRPNIVFLFSDDQTERAIGCYGNTEIKTPHLDQLASDGVRFTNHYNTTSICMASRCCVLTGLYEFRHGCNFSHGDLEQRFFANSYPVLLREAGYFTGFAGKIGFVIQGQKFDSFAPEFDWWAGGPGQTHYETAKNERIAKYADQYPHCSRAYAAWANDFFSAAKASGKPFCLSISFKAPHLPNTIDPLDEHLYDGVTFTRPVNHGVANAAHLSPQSQTSRAATSYREWVEDYDDAISKYYRLIASVDAAVGMIRESLARQGLADNTVVIFTSDNGYNCGAHGFGDKVIPYEEGSKSPLLIYDPRLPKQHAGAVRNAVTGNVDMAATILALASVATPDGVDGRNLRPLLTNPNGQVREFLPLFNFWGIESAQSMAVVTPEWKYIYWYYGGDGMTPTEELFHVGQDRYEMKNLAANPRHAEQLAAMRTMYDAQRDQLARDVVTGHGYENYPVLFQRGVDWNAKVTPPAKADKKAAKKAKRKQAAGESP